jgi:hypothetical protein
MPFDQINDFSGNPLFMLDYVFAADGPGIVGTTLRIARDRPAS